MPSKSNFQLAAVAVAVAGVMQPALAAPSDAEIEELHSRMAEMERRLEATGEALDARGAGQSDTYLGGYGELHYNNLDNQLEGGDDKKMLDFHRFVLFFGHAFDERTRFFSELELEHSLAGEGAPGEVELEQAYVEFDLSDSLRAKGGLFIVPVGILNETHEPPTFYGVERNPVEKNIIPTTWWEGGAALTGNFGTGFSYDLAVHSGLNMTEENADGTFSPTYSIRGGRQKVAEARADALAYTARLKWTGVPGLEVAATVNHQTDVTQGLAEEISANLWEAHTIYSAGPFGLRALYAKWNLDDNGAANGADEQEGWYVEPSFKVTEKVGLFARYDQWDNAAGSAADTEYTQVNAGVNYWPHPDVVLKADYQDQSSPDGKNEFDGFNVGIGYQF